jgi:hypothetical protein
LPGSRALAACRQAGAGSFTVQKIGKLKTNSQFTPAILEAFGYGKFKISYEFGRL